MQSGYVTREWLRPASRFLLREAGHRLPLLSGCGTIANTPPFAWAANESDVIAALLRDGSTLFVHENDYVGRAAYFFGDLDPKITWLCQSVLRPGDLMLDIGGNYGLVTMYAARIVGHSGLIHVFEPQPDLADMIARSAHANGYWQVEVHAFGLSDSDRTVTMNIPDANRGMGSVAYEHAGRHVSVALRRGAPYLARSIGYRRPRFVKLDVEGHESSVFLGAAEWIERVKPEVWVFEHNLEGSLWDVPGLEVLRRMGYRFYGVPKAKLRMYVKPLVDGDRTEPPFNDIVAVHPESDWVPPVRS